MNARTLMLAELSDLLRSRPDSTARSADYAAAVLEENCTARKTLSARQKTWMYLKRLYRFDPADAIFRAFRALWAADETARPLLAFQFAWSDDPILRESGRFFLPMPRGTAVSSEGTFHWVAATHQSFSKGAAASTARNLNSTWEQAGFLAGDGAARHRVAVSPRPANLAFALRLGVLSGNSGARLFETPMAELLDAPLSTRLALAESAAQAGFFRFKRIGDVIEVAFPDAPATEMHP